MRSFRVVFGLITIMAVIICLPLSLLAQLTADDVLSEMGWSAEEKKKILAGEFVTGERGAVSDRDLAISIGFLVKVPPGDLAKQLAA